MINKYKKQIKKRKALVLLQTRVFLAVRIPVFGYRALVN
jgi:hypothetical protein